MPNYIEEIHDNLSAINRDADYLHKLASAFYVTGNSDVGENLARTAGYLTQSAKNISNVLSTELSRRISGITPTPLEVNESGRLQFKED